MNNKIDLTGLFPNFRSVSIPPETAEELSALFFSILVVIFIFFILVTIRAFLKSLRQVSWLTNLLKNEEKSTLQLNREKFKEESNKVRHRHQGGHLWLEFDETLISVGQGTSAKLHNTLEASHFFNSSTLASGITESRMLAAVPGFLTAFGVIGTFVGLQLGLAELNIGNEVPIKEMKSGLAGVINGAKIAFKTSVWGVTLSVLFNIFEKGLEKKVRTEIHKLQTRIDGLFPRLSGEHQLHRIAEDGQQTRESLQGLGEKIGEKLQESLVETVKVIQGGLEASLEKIMGPAINKLVDETSGGNQKALESLVDNFLNRFGELGDSQRDAMDQASHKVSDALGSLSSSMSTFLDRLEVSQGNSADRENELITTISEQVTQLVDHSNEQRTILTEFVENQLSGLSEVFQERERSALERDQRRQEIFTEQSNTIKSSTEALFKRVEEGLDTQLTASGLIIEQGNVLQASIDDSVKANTLASENLRLSANEINSASREIRTLGSHLMNTGNSLSDAITKAVESTAELAHQNKLSSELINQQREHLIEDRQQFSQTIERLQSLINSADSSFDKMREHQGSFLEELKGNVSELANQMTNLLKDYADRANSQTERHLGVWSEHTTNYAAAMNSAAQALSSVVDEIEDKLGGK